jgi:hypothetical protein
MLIVVAVVARTVAIQRCATFTTDWKHLVHCLPIPLCQPSKQPAFKRQRQGSMACRYPIFIPCGSLIVEHARNPLLFLTVFMAKNTKSVYHWPYVGLELQLIRSFCRKPVAVGFRRVFDFFSFFEMESSNQLFFTIFNLYNLENFHFSNLLAGTLPV